MLQTYIKLIAASVILVNSQMSFAKKGSNYPEGFTPKATSGIFFTENKGQVYDQNYKPRPDVLFGAMAGNMAFHLKTTGVSYQLYRVDKWKEVSDEITKEKRKEIDQQTIYRIDLNWVNANKNFSTTTDQTLEGYNNYYLESCPNGALNVKSYTGVTLYNLYKGINLHYYEKNGQLKHDYLVAPHCDYKQIQLKVEGASVSINKDGSLLLSTPLGKIQEGAPIVYQNTKQLKARWLINNKILSFDIEDYNPMYELIIDPVTRLWGTYYGETGSEQGQACFAEVNGDVIISGSTTSGNSSVIATSGSHQQNIGVGGLSDAFLVKFNGAGTRQWGTYYGGIGNEFGSSCISDAIGNIYLAGSTSSSVGTIISTSGSQQQNYGGGNNDAFLVKFNSSGVRQWGTYYGGGGDESGVCSVDATGFVYLMGNTTPLTTSTVIATLGSHQPTPGGGIDLFLVKFDSSGVRQWSTYYGGTGDEYGNLTTDLSGNVYLAGSTSSGTGTIIATSGSHQSAFGGGPLYDAFLVKFNSSGNRLWGTYYGGIGDDQGNACSVDKYGNIYLTGATSSSLSSIISTSLGHQQTYAGGANDGFLVKFNSNGIRQWGTYYGGVGNENSYSCTNDTAANVYIVGATTSSIGISIATSASHQQNFGGGTWDSYLVKFNTNGVRQWGTYYGGNATSGFEFGSSCSAYSSDVVYMAGFTDSNNGSAIATSNGHQSSYGGGSYDAYLVKFKDCALINPSVSVNSSICLGTPIIFSTSINSLVFPLYSWLGPNGYTSTAQSPTISSASLLNTGGYTLTVDNNGCVETTTTQLNVYPVPTISVNSGAICLGQTFTFFPNGAATYTYSSGSSTLTPNTNTTVNVIGTSSVGCISSNTAISSITVNPNPIITVNSGTICSGQSFTLVPSGASTYTYSSGSAIVSPTSNTNYNVTGTSNAGCVSSNTAVSSVTVNALPTVSVNSGTICSGQSFTMVPGGALTYTYSSGSAIVSPTTNANYNVTGTSSLGCVSSNTAVSSVTVNITPSISVNSGAICLGQSFTMVPGGASTYTFSSGSAVVSPTSNASYNVTGTSSLGCVSSNTAVSSITVNALPIVSVNSGTICSGQSFTMVPGGALTYTFSSGSAIVSPTTTANYNVTGTSSLGCISSNTAVSSVSVYASPIITAVSSFTNYICLGESATLTASGANTFTWSSAATSTVISVSPTVTTNYTVTGIDTMGCQNTAVVTQSVDACTNLSQQVFSGHELIVFPNPVHTKLTIVSNGSTQSVQVYNALGAQVYKTTIESEKTEIDLTQHAKGIYFLRIGTETRKLIKE